MGQETQIEIVKGALHEAQTALDRLIKDASTLTSIVKAGEIMANSLKVGGRLYSCGNGGSMCDAMHFAEELAGRFREDRPAYGATAISDPGFLSCAANDYGYERVFSRYVEAHVRKGDVLLAISTSGKSPNVLAAAKQAGKQGAHVVALTGHRDCPLAAEAGILIATPGGKFADRTQELHIKVIHIVIELIEFHMRKS